MDTHTGSTDEYETDEHHFDGDGDSSEDELLVTKKHVSSDGTKKKRGVAVAEKKQPKETIGKRDSEEDGDSDDDEFAPKRKRTKPAASKYDSSSDDESEEEVTNNNTDKRGRRALGKMNDNKTNTKKNTSSRDSDSSASDDNDSDDDSDDLGLGLGSNKQSRAASDRKRAALMQMYPSSSDDSDEDSSDDITFSAKKRKQNNDKKPAAKKPPPSRKNAIALDDSSSSDDSDSECVGVKASTSSTRSRRQPATAAASASAAAIDCMSSDSDEDIEIPPKRGSTRSTRANPRKTAYKTDEGGMPHDPSVRANSNATLEAAKRARAALLQSQGYHAEDVNLPSLPSQVVPAARASPAVLDLSTNDYERTSVSNSASRSVTTPAVSYSGPTITIYLRYRDSSNKESKVSLKIKMDQPLQHLVDQFQRGKITQMKFDGQNLNLTKTPSFYDMDDEDLVDVIVVANHNVASTAAAKAPPRREEKVVIHVRGAAGTRNETYEMKKSDPLKKAVDDYCRKNRLSTVTLEYNGRKLDASQSCSQLNIANNAYLDAIVASGPPINLIFRVNGKSNETERISIRLKETFQQVFETFAQRRNVSVSQCKFVFDGETLRPSTTPEHLDLEGDEIIDVKVTEAARAAPAPALPRAATQSTARAAAAASSASSSSAPVMITIETNRNQNNNSRQKKWKLHDTSLVTKLKTDYTKYYKSKGCKKVKFYIRNQLITNESQSLRDLGIGNGDMVYAMENEKAYKPM
ncbi:ubiquitin family protein [Skeletonema marinoi]|uniref:Ubiquitin family protein n=1 Tax=Skeletonema marinoi TaxID=267567 RepID=A0AAD9D8Z5_9STRA|nr:ubiquitin family protein [Skeletonema marinoi]